LALCHHRRIFYDRVWTVRCTATNAEVAERTPVCMPSQQCASIAAVALFACLALQAQPVSAQGIELMPFGGYRFGGDFFELASGRPVDLDGAPAVGVVVNVPLSNGMQVEAMVTHQHASVPIAAAPFSPASLRRVTVGHAQIGGLQEFANGRMRPFLTGVLGLSRYGAVGDSEVRFSVGAGGGVKLFPVPTVGLRLDGRLYATFVDADARFVACTTGTCVTSFHVDVAWQAEFSAGIVFRLR
jgi:hypothetical protein